MNAAAAGPAMLFICFLALAAIVAVCLLAYIARCVLVVVEATAAGADRVHWPDEGYIDWVAQSLALIGLSVFLLFPAGIVAAAFGLPTVYLIGPVLWLLFPIGTLSSLTGEMRWVFFRPVIATRMVQVLPWTLLFYLCSFLVVSLALGLWYVAVLISQSLPLLCLAAPLSAAMVLVYARLLGLLAWKMGQLGPLQAAAPDRSTRRRGPDLLDSATVPSHIPLPVPRAEPDVEPEPGHIPQSPTGLLDLENLAPYELAADKSPPQPRQSEPQPKRLRPLDPEEIDAQNPYALANPPPPNPVLTTEVLIATLPRSYTEPAAEDCGQANASLLGVIAFPFYDTSLLALLWLTAGSGVLGLLVMEVAQSVPG
jgi:hypothetical protein